MHRDPIINRQRASLIRNAAAHKAATQLVEYKEPKVDPSLADHQQKINREINQRINALGTIGSTPDINSMLG